ncbi:MAG: hypothetical protein ACOCX9_03640 [Spirochaetota bacterium]
MQILVFSDNKGINKPFTRLIKSKEITVHFFSPSEIKKVLKNTAHGSILYVDISDMSPDERAKMMKYLARLENYRYGIIDRKNIIHDVAELFHNNACDYMGKELLKEEIAPKRIKTIETYRAMQLPDEEQNPAASNYILSGNNWNNIKTGQEYTFCMMFIELDNQKELMKTWEHLISSRQFYHSENTSKNTSPPYRDRYGCGWTSVDSFSFHLTQKNAMPFLPLFE